MKLYHILCVVISVQASESHYVFRDPDRHVDRDYHESRKTFPPSLSYEERILVESFDSSSIDGWSYYYTHRRNIAGENKSVPQWTAERWEDFGIKSRLDGYYVYLNYPITRSVQLKYLNGTIYSPSLEEDALDVDQSTNNTDRVPAYHGYSFSGNVSGEYVYVGRGNRQDFDRLISLGVQLEGKVALAKYGGPFRGLKIKNAQEYGMVGALLFTDPGDDHNMTEAHGYSAYPNGPARNPTAIQRGSVVYLSIYPGDPTTPGRPSKEHSPRTEKHTVPGIPSLPISWFEAKPILEALNGFGASASEVNLNNWVGTIPGVAYSTGPALGLHLSLNNTMDDKFTWIWNTIGIINGTEEDEVVIVGNHHDSWMIGGAADPHSGSAIVVELAKAIGNLLRIGWKPRRTIVLASWDAEEYGLVGSTEWVEEFIPWLKKSTVTYINIDVGVSGSIPDFDATPDLHSLVVSIAKKIVWPRGQDETLHDVWVKNSGKIGTLGAQSDYTAFVHRGGIASIDLGTTRAPLDPIYHTHSNYDSYYWMKEFVDPDFSIHKAMGQYLSLFLYHLANDEVVPLEPVNYGTAMQSYFRELQNKSLSVDGAASLDLSELESAIYSFQGAAQYFNALRASAILNKSGIIKELNRRARDFSRGFISQGGLPDRPFFQHLIFAPGVDTGYAPVTFPGITEALEANETELAQQFVNRSVRAILSATDTLCGVAL